MTPELLPGSPQQGGRRWRWRRPPPRPRIFLQLGGGGADGKAHIMPVSRRDREDVEPVDLLLL